MLRGGDREQRLWSRLGEIGFFQESPRETDTYRVPRGMLARLRGVAHDCHIPRNTAVVEALVDWMEKVECEREREQREQFPRLAEATRGVRSDA